MERGAFVEKVKEYIISNIEDRQKNIDRIFEPKEWQYWKDLIDDVSPAKSIYEICKALGNKWSTEDVIQEVGQAIGCTIGDDLELVDDLIDFANYGRQRRGAS